MIMVLRNVISAILAVVILGRAGLPAMAGGTVTAQTIIKDFTMQPQTRWRFFTDQVMGGVSTGGIAFAQEDGASFARMTGRVSTANRGGFIQMRLDLHPAAVFVKQVVRRFHAASLISEALLSRSGFSQTGPAGCQLRVFPDHRSGVCARAFA
jgi:hypothetical protein